MSSAPASKVRRKAKHKPTERGRIELLLVENFKSYEGCHQIGPFDKFTCIIGPNGSGKSNVMDAISFCLGIRTRHLRGDKLKDLVYRREEEDAVSNSRSASVTMVFRTAQGEELHFGRHISPRGVGTFRFGPPTKVRNLAYDDFLGHLAEQHIYVKARNFLVFQGDVMELARRQGMDLTSVLETISGSDQFRDEYNRLSKELETVQEKTRLHFQRRREVESTVAALEKQRAEVQEFQALRARRRQLLAEAVLFKLLCVEGEVERVRGTCNDSRGELERCEAELSERRRATEEVEAKRKKRGVKTEKVKQQDRALASDLERLQLEVANVRSQLVHWEGKLRDKEAQAAAETERHSQLEGSLQALQVKRAKAEAELRTLRSCRAPCTVEMSAAQRASFDEAVAKADAMNTSLREQLREAEDKCVRLSGDELAFQEELRDSEAVHLRGKEQLEEMAHERAGVQHEMEEEQGVQQQQQQWALSVAEDLSKSAQSQASLAEEQRVLRMQLNAARARSERLEQIEGWQRVADELRNAFPGDVLGRISELVLPAQKRFDLPLQTAFGALANALVVRDAATGRKCVRHLKEKRIPSETFLPLDRMAPPRAGGLNLLVQGHKARRLASHCVQHNEKFLERQPRWQAEGPSVIDKAVDFLLSRTIIVDSLDEAKSTFFGDAQEKKLAPCVVTLSGEVISPDGNMRYQPSSSFGHVEFGGVEQLHDLKKQEQQLFQVEKELAKLQEESSRKRRRQAELREQAQELESRQEARAGRIRCLKEAEEAEQRLVDDRAASAQGLRQKIKKWNKKLAVAEESREKLQKESLNVGREYFLELSRELGVDDVREVLHREQKEKQKLRQQIEQQEDHVRTLMEEERLCERSLKSASKLESLRRDCKQLRHDVDDGQKKLQDLSHKERDVSQRSDTVKAQLQALGEELESLELDSKGTTAETQRLRAQVEDLKRTVKRQQDKLHTLLSVRCGVLRDASHRQVEVPFMSKDSAAFEQQLARQQDLDDLPLEELEGACRSVRMDFSLLPQATRDLAARTTVTECKAIEADYEKEIAGVDKDLESLNPNMRALEECALEEEKLEQIRKQAEEAHHETQRLSRAFEQVRTQRTTRFMDCFKHVESKVHPFYKDLTSYDGFDGGSAYLDLDDAVEPYSGGITFTACPPGKRFFPMDLLSGGERSMASLALLLAMHSYNPPPFMILDEVDAPFDRKNTASLVNYLQKLDFQCLVISLKDTFFSHSDSIVGIYKDREAQSSGSLSLPLRRLGDEPDTREAELVDSLV